MRILYVSQFLVRENEPAANRQWDLIKAIRDAGHDVRVLISNRHYLLELEGSKRSAATVTEIWDGIPVTLCRTASGLRRSLFHRLLAYVSFAASALLASWQQRPVDLVIASIPSPLVGVVGWVSARRSRCPMILDVRDVWPETAIALGLLRSPFLIRPALWLERWLYRRPAKIVAITPGIERHLKRCGVPPERVVTIPNGVATHLYQPRIMGSDEERRARRRALGLAEGPFTVIYTGAMGVGNNDLPTLVEAAALIDRQAPIQFVLVGEGDRRPALQAKAREQRLDNIRFLPLVPKVEIPGLLWLADACVLNLPPGKEFELFLQNKIFDYMASARPVIAGVTGDQRDLVESAGCGLVTPPGDAPALARAILRLVGHPQEAIAMGERGRAHVLEHYDRGALVRSYVALIEGTGAADSSLASSPASAVPTAPGNDSRSSDPPMIQR